MRYLTLGEVLALHRRVAEDGDGPLAIRDLPALQSAIAQPRMTFSGSDLYPDLEEKAVALCYSLILNHPFMDGNKRTGHASMETLLVLNGREIRASVDESEKVVVEVAAGLCEREQFVAWLREHIVPLG